MSSGRGDRAAARRVGLPPGVAVLLALALLSGLPGLARAADEGDPEGPGPLPWRVPGRVAFTVDAATFPDSSGHTLEVYLRVPPGTLTRLARDAGGSGRLRLTARVTNRFGGRPQEKSQEFEIASGDTAAGFGKVVIMRFTARPGVSRLRVRLEDRLSRKRGIGYIGRRVTESGTVEGELTVPAPQAGRDLSDLEFLWVRREAASTSPFRRGEHLAIPNPERLYGLLANEVRAEFAARALAGDARAWHWHARVLDASGRMVAEQRDSAAASPRLAAGVTIDMASEPAGGYDLEVKAWQAGDPGALVRTAHFSIGWLPATWLVDPSEADDAVHFLLSAEEERRFARMHVGERERFLEDFWRRRDPTPDTAENEARLDFQARIDHANANFEAPGNERGMFSDMGRVYIRYGEPDEVLKQVIPAGDETLARVLRELEISEDRPTGDVHQKGLGGDQRAYEVWVYESLAGATPDTDPERLDHVRSRRRLVFLFVDEHGYGNFTLRYSTE
jgi:GWxTD domain-containing protein